MARGSDAAQTAANSANAISGQTSANANALYGTLAPELESEVANPQGINPVDMANLQTSAQQSAGGSEAAGVGQGLLHAARTRNAGGADAAIAKSARSAGENLSKGVLGTQIQNAREKERQQESATSGLEGLYGTNLGESVGSLGQVANNVNANTNSSNASWDWAKYLLDPAMADAASGTSAAFGG
jgi:hypothetical protein